MENIEIKHGLNSRQFALYRHLKDKGDTWTTQEQLARELKDFYFDNDLDKPFHDRRVRMLMTVDIRAINESGLIQKIILSSSKGIKIATEKEFDKYISKNIEAIVRKLNRFKQMAKKGTRHNQFKIQFGKYERYVTEAFLPEENELTK